MECFILDYKFKTATARKILSFLIYAVNKFLGNILQGIEDLVTLDTNRDAGSELQGVALILIIYYIKQ
jgi:hypothetical protein